MGVDVDTPKSLHRQPIERQVVAPVSCEASVTNARRKWRLFALQFEPVELHTAATEPF
jgi:hypothetical protein